MKSELSSNIRYTDRWFCYFDLLGFKNLVYDKNIERVTGLYEKALDHLDLSKDEKKQNGIYISWFSDTFIIYSRGGKDKDFANIEAISRRFFQHLILNKIAVRGALTFGKLYSQQERNIFIGPALIDAYSYGEGQNWLGFALTPTAVKRLSEINLEVRERTFYRKVFNNNILKKGIDGPIYAYAFNNGLVNGKNPLLKALYAMKENVDLEYQEKYKNTIEFIEHYS